MTAIAEGRILTMLAEAEGYLFFLFNGKFYGSKVCALVAAITEGLILRLTAAAPPVISSV